MSHLLAIDPGYDRVGVAVFEGMALIYSDCILTDKELPFAERIAHIGRELERLFETYTPAEVALESLFFNTNRTSGIKVAEMRGALIYLAAMRGVPVTEYAPSAIKVAVTGYGKSTKEEVMRMVPKLVRLEPKKRLDDEIDAIAVGLTHLASRRDPRRFV